MTNLNTKSEIDYKVDDQVSTYLKTIGQYPLLTHEDEINLAAKAHNGDLSAQERLITCNLRLVVYHAKNYIKKSESYVFLDLIQEGTLGLMEAIERYDENSGYRFSTYASWWIKAYIRRALKTTDKMIRKPSYCEENYYKIAQVLESKGTDIFTEEIFKEIFDITGLNKETVLNVYENMQSTISYDIEIDDGESKDVTTFRDFLLATNDLPEEEYLKIELKEILNQMMDQYLTEKQSICLKRKYGLDGYLPEKVEDIAKDYGVTVSAINNNIKIAIDKLKKYRYQLSEYRFK